MWAVVLGVLSGAIAEAVEVVHTARRTSVSISAGYGPEDEVQITSSSAAEWPAPRQASSAWLPFRNGDLWADYCRSANCAAISAAADCPQSAPPAFSQKPRRRCCRRYSSPLELLRGLLGWRPSPMYHVMCHERGGFPEPDSSIPIDAPPSLPPALPPTLSDPRESRERANAAPAPEPPSSVEPPAELDIAPAPADPVPVPLADLAPVPPADLAPVPPVSAEPGSSDESDAAPGDMELSPVPGNDPAPEPPLEVPRNVLPKSPSARGESTSNTNIGTVMTRRLSDFIRTR
ncbi:MAG: hypothetical protein ACYC3X_03905 [Pirellulaceae bacterium]